jgi:predicted GIY-YIG superfamily endonuclease
MTRDTYKYHFKKGNKIVHTGITNDLERREGEHKDSYGDDGHIKQVGRRTTRDAALDWEADQTKRGNPTRRKRR